MTEELFWFGLVFGLFPLFFTIILGKDEFKTTWLRFIRGKKGVLVKMIWDNNQTETGIGKFVGGREIRFKKNNYPFNPELIGLEGRTSSVILRESGRQINIKDDQENIPITAKQYNSAIMDAIMAGADNLIIKRLNSLKLLIIASLIASGAAAFLAWSLVDNLI